MLWGVLHRVGYEYLVVVEYVNAERGEACWNVGVGESSSKRGGFERAIENVDARVPEICGEQEVVRAVGKKRKTFIDGVGAGVEVWIVDFEYRVIAAGPGGDGSVLGRENEKRGATVYRKTCGGVGYDPRWSCRTGGA